MLDDCKGDKFEELLAGFSAVVLRKVVAVSMDEASWSPAMRLSTATSMTPTDYQNLLPLILAHQVSLGSAGERQSRVRDAYDRFEQLLDEKKIELTGRAIQETGVSQNGAQVESDGLVHEIRTNWLGSEEWATALLEGGSQSSTDAFLELPFPKALAQATDSNVDSLGNGLKPDLVLDLEARVLLQRSRLRKWHEYNQSLSKERGIDETITAPVQEPRMLFRDHQALTVASISKTVRQPGERGRMLKGADKYLLSSVNEALTRINGKSRTKTGALLADVKTSNYHRFDESVEDASTPSTVGEDHHYTPSPTLHQDSPEPEPELEPKQHSEPELGRPSPPIVRFSPDNPSSDDEPDPEPVKRPQTLVERTRRSMSLLPPVPHEAPRPRRRPRPSYPVNQFATPRKPSGRSVEERSRAPTPQDQLFHEDAEYASVFKSRPRVALSPISSPAVHVIPSFEDESFALDYEDESDDEEWGQIDSPLAASRLRA